MIRNILNTLILLTYFIFEFSFSSISQTKAYQVFNVENGLPSNTVYDVKQCGNGFIWMATNRGLVKYDGSKFKVFSINDGLPNSDIWHLETDAQNRVWLFSKSNYQGYIKNDSVILLKVEGGKTISPSLYHKTNSDVIYSSGKLYHKSGDGLSQLMTFENFREKNLKLTTNSNKYPWPQEKRPLLVSLESQKVSVFDFQTGKLVMTKDIQHQIETEGVLKYGALPNHNYFIATAQGVLLINLTNKKVKYLPFNKSTKSVYITYSKNIQVSVENTLYLFNDKLENTTNYIIPNSIKSFQDKDGNVWAIDLSNGVQLYASNQLKNSYYFMNNKVESIGVIENQLFVGIYKKGIFELEPKTGSPKNFPSPDLKPYSIQYDFDLKQGYINGSVQSYIYSDKVFTSLKNYLPKGMQLDGSRDIVQKGDELYIAKSSSLFGVNLKTRRTIINIINRGVYRLCKYKNTVYVGSLQGLKIVKNSKLQSIKKLNNIPIQDLKVYKNHLFIGSQGKGVYCYNQKKLVHIKETKGLMIQKILNYDGFLWLATQSGVIKVKLNWKDISQSSVVNSFYKSDGLTQNNVNDIAIYQDHLYVATDIGVSKIKMKHLNKKEQLNLIFSVGSQNQIFKSDNSNVSFSFSVINYTNQDNFKYRYRLHPNQAKWTQLESKTINFSTLPFGKYTLQVEVRDQHNNTIRKKLYFEIKPAWWETILSKFLILIFSLLITTIIYTSIQSRKLKKTVQRKNTEQSIISLELQALRSQMNPHFVSNSLNSIQYYIQKNDIENSEYYLSKFAHLIRSYFDYSKEKTITIEQETTLLTNYLEIESLRFEEKLSYLIRKDKKIQSTQEIPTMILQPILENAINHGVFHKAGKGEIQILFEFVKENQLKVKIQDNGIGVDRGKKLNKNISKDLSKRSSSIISNRIDLLNQSNEWQVVYNTRNLSEVDYDKGTVVQISFTKL